SRKGSSQPECGSQFVNATVGVNTQIGFRYTTTVHERGFALVASFGYDRHSATGRMRLIGQLESRQHHSIAPILHYSIPAYPTAGCAWDSSSAGAPIGSPFSTSLISRCLANPVPAGIK